MTDSSAQVEGMKEFLATLPDNTDPLISLAFTATYLKGWNDADKAREKAAFDEIAKDF